MAGPTDPECCDLRRLCPAHGAKFQKIEIGLPRLTGKGADDTRPMVALATHTLIDLATALGWRAPPSRTLLASSQRDEGLTPTQEPEGGASSGRPIESDSTWTLSLACRQSSTSTDVGSGGGNQTPRVIDIRHRSPDRDDWGCPSHRPRVCANGCKRDRDQTTGGKRRRSGAPRYANSNRSHSCLSAGSKRVRRS